MTAEILSIGDELLIGQIVNTNSSWIAEQLSATGINVSRITTVGDSPGAIENAIRSAWNEHDITLVTGGLGPTHDDVTREVVAGFFDDSLVLSDTVLADVTAFFARREREMGDVHRDQAMVPSTARVIRNSNGTAPGMHFERSGKHLFAMPGVPFEMHAMVESYVLPLLASHGDSTRVTKTILTTGIPESALAERLSGIESMEVRSSIAYLPSPLGVRIRITTHGGERKDAEAASERLQEFLRERAGEFVFGTESDRLEETVGLLLSQHGKTLAVAESCTGGRIADRITDVPGSSRYFTCGVVAYSNESKTDLLDVDPSLFVSYGAVSEETAKAMASGIRIRSGASIGISTTGIAGPGGGSPSKPVGLVWIGLSSGEGSSAHRFLFGEDRGRTKQRATQMALDLVRRHLLHLPIPPSH